MFFFNQIFTSEFLQKLKEALFGDCLQVYIKYIFKIFQ